MTKAESLAYDKAEECTRKMERLRTLLKKTINNIKYCRKECRSASSMLGDLNGARRAKECE